MITVITLDGARGERREDSYLTNYRLEDKRARPFLKAFCVTQLTSVMLIHGPTLITKSCWDSFLGSARFSLNVCFLPSLARMLLCCQKVHLCANTTIRDGMVMRGQPRQRRQLGTDAAALRLLQIPTEEMCDTCEIILI